MRGAPLWFAGVVIGGWTLGRVVALMPAALSPNVPGRAPARPAAQTHRSDRPIIIADRDADRPAAAAPFVMPNSPAAAPQDRHLAATPLPQIAVTTAPASPVRPDQQPATDRESAVPISPPLTPITAATSPSRFHVDAWLVARPSGGETLAFGQLGASQGGARLTYALDQERRVALSARASTPLRGTGAEAGLGVDVRPIALPLHLLLEERIGQGSRPAAAAIFGGSLALPARLRLDGYAQGGGVARRGAFADGAALIVRPVGEDRTRLEVGAGAWGAAQRGVARLDIGLSVAAVTPLAGKAIRLQLDYGIM